MIQYQKKVFDNALTVIVEQDKTTAMAAVNVLYGVGSRNELPDKTGFAHLFEHLMFGGTKLVPNFDEPLQAAGGENNAFTNNDYTCYYDIVPAQNIEIALFVEADRMSNLIMNQRTLDIQKKVVLEEFKEVCLNKPYGDSWHYLTALSFEKHPYGWPTIGKVPEHVESATLEDVRYFYETFYQPQNTIISISSPLAHKEVFSLINKYFGSLTNTQSIKPQFESEPIQSKSKVKNVYGPVPMPIFMMAFHMPGRNSPEYYACDLTSDILANGKSSRFYDSLVKKQKLMSQVDCYITGSLDPGLIVIEGTPMPGIAIEQCTNAIWQILEDLKSTPIAERELEKVKNKVISSLYMTDLNLLNRAISLSYFEWLGNLEEMNQQEDIYCKVTSEQILESANRFFTKSNLSQLNYLPTDFSSN